MSEKVFTQPGSGGGVAPDNGHDVDTARSYQVLLILLVAYILSFVDRNVMSILVGPIRSTFDISDFQFGLLQGLAFSIFYTLLGLPIGRLADRYPRRWVLFIGIAFWSLMTCACGFAGSFLFLFLARMGVGLGEAALSPPAHSLLSDYFSPSKLPYAMAVFTLGITIGGGMAYMIGGWVYSVLGAWKLPSWLGSLQPWQLTFVVVGLPGLLVAALALSIREPKRQGLLVGVSGVEQLSVTEVLGYIWRRRRLYWGVFFGVSLLSVLGYGYMSWYVEFLIRTFAVERQSVGMQFGWMFIVIGSLGALWGAWLAGMLRRREMADANLRLVMIVALLWMLPAALGPLMPGLSWALWLAAPSLFFLNSYFGVAIAALQIVTPNQMRAQVSAMLLFMTNLLGLGLGPVLVGFFTDYVFASDAAIGQSLSLLALICCPLAALAIWVALPAYREELEGLELRLS